MIRVCSSRESPRSREGGTMKAVLLAFVLAACASAPVSDGEEHAVFSGYAVEPVREAALAAVEDVAHPISVVRVTEAGSVLTDGRIGDCGKHVACKTSTAYPGDGATPWTTIEVRFQDLGQDTAVEVAIEYESCEPGPGCVPERYASSGELEREIFEGIRARLDSAAGSTRPPADHVERRKATDSSALAGRAVVRRALALDDPPDRRPAAPAGLSFPVVDRQELREPAGEA